MRALLIAAISILLQAAPSAEKDVVVSTATADEVMLLNSEALREQFEYARQAYLSFRLEDAENEFYRLADSEYGRIAGYLYLSSISMYRFLMTDRDHYEDEFLQRSDSLKKMLDDIEDTPWRIFIGAEANLQRAVVRTKRGKYLRAALAARLAYGEYARLVEKDPTFYDAYKGLGLLHMTIEYSPGFYKRFLRLLGYSSETGQGIRELQLAADSSAFNREEARVMLGVLDVVLFESQRNGEEMLRSLYERYPDNPIFSHVLGFYLYSNRRVDEAIELFQQSADRYGDSAYFFIDYTDQFLATCYFYRGEFEKSIYYNKRYLENHPGPAVKAPANLNTGLALELLGRRHEAIPYYEAVHSTREFDIDDVAEKRAQQLAERPMTEDERTLLLANNALESGRYNDAESIIKSYLSNLSSDNPHRVEAMYVLARVYHVSGQRALAYERYQQVIDTPVEPDARWAPWAEYYRGVMFEEDDRHSEARFAFERTLRYDGDFDYKRSVHDLSKLALKRLSLEP